MRSDDVFSAAPIVAAAETATAAAEFTEVAEAPDEPCLLGVLGEASPSENESWWRLLTFPMGIHVASRKRFHQFRSKD